MRALLVHDGGLEDVVCALRVGWPSVGVLHAGTRRQALESVRRSSPDLIIVDTEMASVGELELLCEVRRLTEAVIIALSREYDEAELVAAVEAGCDDYMQVPVSPASFVARVRAVVRRARMSVEDEQAASWGDLEVDPGRYEARIKGQRLRLTATEFKMLLYLARRGGRVATHESLCSVIWGEDADVYASWLRKYIQHLRQKLADVPYCEIAITTVPRVGYKLVAGGGQESAPAGQLNVDLAPTHRRISAAQ